MNGSGRNDRRSAGLQAQPGKIGAGQARRPDGPPKAAHASLEGAAGRAGTLEKLRGIVGRDRGQQAACEQLVIVAGLVAPVTLGVIQRLIGMPEDDHR